MITMKASTCVFADVEIMNLIVSFLVLSSPPPTIADLVLGTTPSVENLARSCTLGYRMTIKYRTALRNVSRWNSNPSNYNTTRVGLARASAPAPDRIVISAHLKGKSNSVDFSQASVLSVNRVDPSRQRAPNLSASGKVTILGQGAVCGHRSKRKRDTYPDCLPGALTTAVKLKTLAMDLVGIYAFSPPLLMGPSVRQAVFVIPFPFKHTFIPHSSHQLDKLLLRIYATEQLSDSQIVLAIESYLEVINVPAHDVFVADFDYFDDADRVGRQARLQSSPVGTKVKFVSMCERRDLMLSFGL